MNGLLSVFAEAFNEPETYSDKRPSVEYLRSLLSRDYFIALAAINDGAVIGGIAGYELKKFEQQRSEIYIYDLAVAKAFRRQGVATSLIEKLKQIAAERGAYVVFVQADHGDDPAIALYSKFGEREEVLHFDIDVSK
nr:AAC(3)-I family aminoglycoside N-acetyltransferase [Permianibacter aggregans]